MRNSDVLRWQGLGVRRSFKYLHQALKSQVQLISMTSVEGS